MTGKYMNESYVLEKLDIIRRALDRARNHCYTQEDFHTIDFLDHIENERADLERQLKNETNSVG